MTLHAATISGADWARSLAAARIRRRPSAADARRFSGPVCPVCGRPGLHRELTGGTEIVHGAAERCWHPKASAFGIDTTARKEAA